MTSDTGIIALLIAILCIAVRIAFGFRRKMKMAIFLASRGYQAVSMPSTSLEFWMWKIPGSERDRIETEVGEMPRNLLMADAYRRAKLEEEREKLQLPKGEVVPMMPRQGGWR